MSLGDIVLIESKRKEIRNLVNNVVLVPSFQNQSFKQIIGQTSEYIAANNVLDNHEITFCTNCFNSSWKCWRAAILSWYDFSSHVEWCAYLFFE